MADIFDKNTLPKVFYLHHSFQKFWEIVIDPSNNSTKERFGNLTMFGQEDMMNIQTKTIMHRSWEEALNTAQAILNQKTAEGYASYEKPNAPYLSINNIPLTQSVVPSPSQIKPLSEPRSLEKSGSLRLKRKPKESLVREDNKMVKKTGTGQSRRHLEFSPEETINNNSGIGTRIVSFLKNFFTPNKEDEKDSIGRELPISSRVYKQAGVIQKKAKDLNLKCEIHEDAVMVLGEARKVDLLEDFLKDLEEENSRNEIELSTVLRGMPDMIIKKAQELNVRCEFFDQKLVMKGNHEDVDDLVEYLGELEANTVNSKYPNFHSDHHQGMMRTEEIKIEATNNYHPAGYPNYGPELQPMMSSHIPVAPINSFGNLGVGEDHNVLNAIQSVHDTLNGVKRAVDLLENKETNKKSSMMPQENNNMMEISYKKQGSLEKYNGGGMNNSGGSNLKSEDFGSTRNVQRANQSAHESLDDMARRIEYLEAQINNQRTNQAQLDLAKPFTDLVRAMGDKVKGIAHTYSSIVGSHLDGMVGNKDQGEFVQKQIVRPNYLRPCPDEVIRKAKDLGIELETTFEVFVALGYQSNIDKFTIYLMEANLKAQKNLFPTYYNLHEPRPYSIIFIPPEHQEYKEITRTFTSYMTGHRICSLERIQNKNLMNRYINNIQANKELRKGQDLQRRQLFYGTGSVSPATLYDASGNGFDPRYADVQTSKGFGRGYCFSVNPYHSHARAHRTHSGKYQILIADVFVGKTCQSGPGNLIKAPKGYDSVSQNSELFVVFDEAASCPLYLIEYE